jgi:hypothetical protein
MQEDKSVSISNKARPDKIGGIETWKIEQAIRAGCAAAKRYFLIQKLGKDVARMCGVHS